MTDRSMEAVAAEAAPVRGLRGLYYGWWLVGAAFAAQLISVGAQNYVLGPFVTPMTDELEWGRSEFVLARTIGMTLFAMTGLFIGSYVDRRGGRQLMRVGALILGAAMFGQSYVQELWQWWLLNGVILTSGAVMTGNLVGVPPRRPGLSVTGRGDLRERKDTPTDLQRSVRVGS